MSNDKKKRVFSKQARINMSRGAKGKIITNKTRLKISEALKKHVRTDKHCQNISKFHGRYWLGRKQSKEANKKRSFALKGKMPKYNFKGKKGKLSLRWNPDRTDKRERCSEQYKNWRLAVYNRDGFKCQNCKQIGKDLHAHHILAFAKYPTLRFKVNNGVTLCKRCHNKVHNRKTKKSA